MVGLLVHFLGHPAVADGRYHGDSDRVVGVFWLFAIHLGWGLHACGVAFMSCEIQQVLSEVEVNIMVSHLEYPQH